VKEFLRESLHPCTIVSFATFKLSETRDDRPPL